MLRHALAGIAVLVLTTGSTKADKDAAVDSAKGETHRLNFDRQFKAGQRFMITGNASRAQTLIRTTESGKSNRQTRENRTLQLKGELEIVKVNDEHKPTEIQLTVHSFKAKWKESGDGESNTTFKKGTVLIGKGGRPDSKKFSGKDRDVDISNELAELIDALLPLADKDDDDKKFKDPLTGTQERKVGETWKLKLELPGQFKKSKSSRGTATFAGIKNIRDRKAAHMRVKVDVKGIEADESIKGGTLELTMQAWLPLDSKMPPLKAQHTMVLTAKVKGEAAKLLKNARFEFRQEVQRELQPIE